MDVDRVIDLDEISPEEIEEECDVFDFDHLIEYELDLFDNHVVELWDSVIKPCSRDYLSDVYLDVDRISGFKEFHDIMTMSPVYQCITEYQKLRG